MKYFVVSDVHSFYKKMKEALGRAGFDETNPNHTLISCGDLFDRGKESKEVLEYIMSLKRKILVEGNHDVLIRQLIYYQRYPEYYDNHNGTIDTILQLGGEDNYTYSINKVRENELMREYLRSLRQYYETENYIFVHSWIPQVEGEDGKWQYKNFRQASRREFEQAEWGNPFERWKDMKNDPDDKLDKTVVFGHWHTSWAHSHFDGDGYELAPDGVEPTVVCNFKPYYGDGIIGMDGCTAYSGVCNCIVLDDEPLD